MPSAAVQNLHDGQTVGSICLFSARHDFPTQWAKFQSATIDPATAPTAELQVKLTPELYPFWAQDFVAKVPLLRAITFFAEMSPGDNTTKVNIYEKADKSGNNNASLAPNPSFGNLLTGSLPKPLLPPAVTDAAHPLTLYFDDNTMTDLWLAVTWGT